MQGTLKDGVPVEIRVGGYCFIIGAGQLKFESKK